MRTNLSQRRAQITREWSGSVEATDRFVDIGVTLHVVKADPAGKVLIEGARPMVILRTYNFGGIVDTKANPPRIVDGPDGISRNPQVWYCSEDQERVILHADSEPVGKLARGGMGAGKCLAADTEVFDYRTGRRRRLDEPGELDVATFDKTLKVAPASAFPSGEKQCVDVRLRDGTSLIASTDHPILTARGWVHAAELRADDFVAVAVELPDPSTTTSASDDEVAFLAYMLSDGGCSWGSMTFTNETPQVIDDWMRVTRSVGYGFWRSKSRSRASQFTLSRLRHRQWSRAHDRCRSCDSSENKHAGDGLCGPCSQRLRYRAPRPKSMLTFVREDGRQGTQAMWVCRCECGNETRVRSIRVRNGEVTSCGCRRALSWSRNLETRNDTGIDLFRERWGLHGLAKDKRLHPDLWGLPRHQVALFVNRFWACDGHVSIRGLETTLASEKMIDDLRFMLLRLGIRSRKHYKRSSYVKDGIRHSFDAWRLSMSGADALKFLTDVGDVLGKEDACMRLRAALESTKRNTNFDVVPIGRKEIREIHREVGLGSNPRGHGKRKRHGNDKQCLSRSTFRSICDQLGYNGKYAHLATSDVAWERVASISDVGIRPVYDLTVPGTHNFVANGIVVHNTTAGIIWVYLRWLEELGTRNEMGITAPTETRLSLVFNELFKMFPSAWWRYNSETKILTLCDGFRVRGVSTHRQSASAGSRLQAFNWVALLDDEGQDSVDEFIHKMARLRSKTDGRAKRLMTVTAKDDPAFRTLEQQMLDSNVWMLHSLLGPNSPFISPEHWDTMKRSMTERDYRRLVLAEDLPSELRLYSTFDRKLNIRPIPLGAKKVTSAIIEKRTGAKNRGVGIGHDPGTAKAGSVWCDAYMLPKAVALEYGAPWDEPVWFARAELFTHQEGAEVHALKAMDITQKRFGCNLSPYGDFAHVRSQPLGQAEDKPDRSTQAIWQRVGFEFKFSKYSKDGKGIGQIKKDDRIGVVCTLFCNAYGKRRLFLECDDSGKCETPLLLTALETMERDHLGRAEHEEKNVKHDKSDLPAGLGYWLYPFEKELSLALRNDLKRDLGGNS